MLQNRTNNIWNQHCLDSEDFGTMDCVTVSIVCTARWLSSLSCYDEVCFLPGNTWQTWVPHVFLWPWMSDKVIILRIILIIFRMYPMRHILCSQKRNTKHEITCTFNTMYFFFLFYFLLCPQFTHATHAPVKQSWSWWFDDKSGINQKQINRLSSDI